MCLSTVFTYQDNPEDAQEMCANVSNFQVDGDTVTFTDLLGENYTVKGAVNKVDFVKSRIYVAV